MTDLLELAPIEETWRDAFDLLMRVSGISNCDVGKKARLSTSAISARRRGISRIHPIELDRFADALGVPVEVLSLDRSTLLRWLSRYAAWDSNPEPTEYADTTLKRRAA